MCGSRFAQSAFGSACVSLVLVLHWEIYVQILSGFHNERYRTGAPGSSFNLIRQLPWRRLLRLVLLLRLFDSRIFVLPKLPIDLKFDIFGSWFIQHYGA